MKRIAFTLTIAALLPFLANAQTSADSLFNLNKFAGTWYEVAYLQNDEQADDYLTAVTVNYVVTGTNKFYEEFKAEKKKNGKVVTANTKLKYKGNGIIKAANGAKCRVLALDSNYDYIMLGTTNHKYVWILSRTKHLDMAVYTQLLDKAANMGFETEQPGLMANR